MMKEKLKVKVQVLWSSYKIIFTIMDGECTILGQCSYIFYTSLIIPGDYLKAHDLRQGDFIVIYKDDGNDRFVHTFPHQHLTNLHNFFGILSIVAHCVLFFVKVIGAKKAGYEQTATVPQIHQHMHLSATLPAPQVFHDYASSPVAPEADMLAIVPQADEIFDGILNSLPEIPVANMRYSDFFDPFGDSMDMANPLGSNHPANLATHFHDEKTGSSAFPYPKSGPLV
jgi:hypothetical protein